MNSVILPKHVAAVIKYQKDPIKALQMFNSVKKENGFKHTLLTYKCMIDKLGFFGEFEPMEMVMDEMRVNIDNRYLEGVYICSMRNYARKRKIQEAVNVFERMDFYNCEPTVFSYNVVMNILVENLYFNQAHKVYMRMKDRGIAGDVYTYTIRIKSFCRTNRPYAALRLLNNMSVQGCELNSVAYCTVVGGFYDGNHQNQAYQLFDEMLSRKIVPNVATFNKLLHKLCRKGDIKESERLLNKVLKRGVFPNLFTFNIFVQGLCFKGQLDEAERMLNNTGKSISPDVVTYNTLLCGFCKKSKMVEAEKYVHKMVNSGLQPDSFTYNTIIDGYCKSNMVAKADKILQDAISRGFVPDEFTYCSLLYGLCEEGDTERSIRVFKEASGKGVKASVILYNGLIKGFCRQGLVLEALQLINEMEEKGCPPNVWTYNLIIDGMCKMGCVNDASTVMNDAINKGVLPDIFMFNTLIDGYKKQLKMDHVLEIINIMPDHGVIPDIITYNTILDGLCKTSTSDDVMEAFKEMVEKGCVPNVVTYNMLIESHCNSRKLQRASLFLDEMCQSGVMPDTVTFSTLIDGYCENGELDEAYDMFRRMEKEYNVSPTVSTYNILINAFSGRINMDMAEKLFQELGRVREHDNYSYRCMIDGFCKVGNVDSAFSFLVDNIMKGFIPSLTTIGRVLNCLCTKHKLCEAVAIIQLMVHKGIVPEAVDTIFEADKKEIAAPKIVVEDLLKKSHVNYYSYELLYDAVRDKKLVKRSVMNEMLMNHKQIELSFRNGFR